MKKLVILISLLFFGCEPVLTKDCKLGPVAGDSIVYDDRQRGNTEYMVVVRASTYCEKSRSSNYHYKLMTTMDIMGKMHTGYFELERITVIK